MCGRYRLSRRKQLIQEYFDATELNRLGRGGDQRGYIEIGPLGWPAGEDQFDLIEDAAIRSRHAPLLPAQFPIATVVLEQIPVLAMDGGCKVGRLDIDRGGRAVTRAAGVGSEELFRDALFPSRRKDSLPLRYKPWVSSF